MLNWKLPFKEELLSPRIDLVGIKNLLAGDNKKNS